MAAKMKILVSLFFVFLCFGCCLSSDMTIGSNKGKLAYVENVSLSARPSQIQTRKIYYTGTSIIRGIYAVDRDNTNAVVKVSSGGVGSTFTNLKIKSERGRGLNYLIQIYV